MKVKRIASEATTVPARLVPQGKVYTWGTGVTFYISTQSGAVCLNDGHAIAVSSPTYKEHFDQQVRVVECELHVQE